MIDQVKMNVVENAIKIGECLVSELSDVQELYSFARSYQKTKGVVVWPPFADQLVMADIKEKRLFKIEIDQRIAAVFTITEEDALIWAGKDHDSALYIHRIATHPKYRGRHLVKHIVAWTKARARDQKRPFIRLDTVGENTRLIDYYQSCGFTFLGMYTLANTERLPAHYAKGGCCLFELRVESL
jgi:ribosomal protein S18 acetylase RimI-like enzyme